MSDESNEAPEPTEPKGESRESIFSYLKQQRDELKVKLHLGGKEARAQWDRLEAKWHEVEEWGEPLTSATKEAATSAGQQAKKVTAAALDVAAREIRSGYDKLRRLLD